MGLQWKTGARKAMEELSQLKNLKAESATIHIKKREVQRFIRKGVSTKIRGLVPEEYPMR
jgi:hypothetical protein